MTDDQPALFGPDGEPTIPPAEPRARRTDPATSHDAARSIKAAALRASQEAVLKFLRRHGPATDVELVEGYPEWARALHPPQSPSGLRTRRHELVEAGAVVDTGDRAELPSGRKAIVWAAA